MSPMCDTFIVLDFLRSSPRQKSPKQDCLHAIRKWHYKMKHCFHRFIILAATRKKKKTAELRGGREQTETETTLEHTRVRSGTQRI